MRTLGPWFLLGTLSAAASGSAMAVDTSQWKCEKCPFEKEQFSASVEGGGGNVSEESAKFGDYTGLDKKGPYFVLGGSAQYRGPGGTYGSVTATDLGLDSRAIEAEGGKEGRFALRFGYSEIPRHFTDNAVTPFIGSGGSVLTLPSGYPAVDTASMPLATTVQPVETGYKRKRFDLGATAPVGDAWSVGASWHRDTRDGTQPIAGSFFSSSSQLAAPVDQVTDQLEVATSYFTPRLQAKLALQLSSFRNHEDSLTWSNPFTPIVTGGDRGQLALAPDNQFWQIVGSAGYEITPRIRASADISVGRMTQDSSYLAPTLNASLAPPAQLALPAQSLDGRVDTFNSSVRITAAPTDPLRVNASWARDMRDNRTPSLSYPAVSTDTFLDPTNPRTNQPFSYRTDRFKLNADYRFLGSWKSSLGVDYDERERTLQEVVYTRETTFWGELGAQTPENLSWWLRLAHADRNASTYGIATWVDPPENPLLRKFNLADRTRNSAKVRFDLAITETLAVGLNYELADDDYKNSQIGLLDGRTTDVGGDISFAINDQTHLFVFAQSERTNSRQAGSQVFATPDWFGYFKDNIDIAGLGIKNSSLKGKLDLSADFTVARMRSDVTVDAGANDPPFPTMKTSRETLKLRGAYRVRDNLSVIGTYWYEHYDSQDWRLDGVQPSTVPNLLTFGEQSPRYHVNVFSLALRYWFQ
ncbi:MAG TPA: MtrB/PioB family decaheme-associated outer membrane protein [Burkholderiaceae bacterium]|nr:MtrB/PioB family decaheme-associated outer membrane protein [Burkholderiaceae bacterium]